VVQWFLKGNARGGGALQTQNWEPDVM
ncbi:hypothetical protein Tco_1395807, partial [Tanacetum coccineum]